MAQYPREDVGYAIKQTDRYKQDHLDYAESLIRNSNNSRDVITRLYNSYNGIKKVGATDYIDKRYGRQNSTKLVTFKVGRTKLNLLHGEQLKRPLSATVETINSDAISEKMQQMDMMIGAMFSKKEIEDLKNIAGVDVMEGAPIPNDEDDPIWKKMNPKDKEEDIMQIILNNQIIELNLRKQFADLLLDVLICSMCYCKIESDQNGDIKIYRIDPRDAIFEEIQGDDYIERSPIMGCLQRLTITEVLTRYSLTKDQRDILDAARANPQVYLGSQGRGRGFMNMTNGQLMLDVIHIEWDSVEPMYFKKVLKTKSQKELNPEGDYIKLKMNSMYYENNLEKHNSKVEKGEYEIETQYKIVKYEATRIGGCIDVNMREKPFQVRSVDKPSYVSNTTYHGFICGTVDGKRVSVQSLIEPFDTMYDVNAYQINKDLSRAKGKALLYDLAGLPEGKKMKDILFSILNDGVVEYNSAAAGNFSGRNLDLVNAIKEIDLGLSESLQYSLTLQQNILNQLSQITGISENREGQIAASSTAANANSAISASRTITEPIFYGMDIFTRKVMTSIVNVSAINWAFIKVDKGEQILGTERFRYLQASKKLGFKDYGVHIEDGSRYMEMRNEMKRMMEFSLNSKQITPQGMAKVLLSETTAQMIAAANEAWDKINEAQQKSNEANNQMQQQIAEAKLRQQIEISNADREDRQVQAIDEINIAADAQMRIDDNKAKNKMFENKQVADNDLLKNI